MALHWKHCRFVKATLQFESQSNESLRDRGTKQVVLLIPVINLLNVELLFLKSFWSRKQLT